MLYDKKQLPELRYMKHLHDDSDYNYDYENNILKNNLSPYLYENSVMANFLFRLQKLVSLSFDQFNIIRNWRNYMVDKYYYKHQG